MKNRIDIFFASDGNGVPYLSILLASIQWATREFGDPHDKRGFQFYVIDNGIGKMERRLLEQQVSCGGDKLCFMPMDIASKIPEISTKTHVPISAYCRYFFPDMAPTVSRALYIDIDAIALGDIRKIYDLSMDGHPVAFDGLNNGVILFDCEKWRRDNLLDRFLARERETRQEPRYGEDQQIFKEMFLSGYKQFPPHIYNGEFWSPLYVRAETISPKTLECLYIRHFAGGAKPWNTNIIKGKPMPSFNEWWFFAQMTPFFETLKMRYLERTTSEKINYKFTELTKKVEILMEKVTTKNTSDNDILLVSHKLTKLTEQVDILLKRTAPRKYPKLIVNLICCFIPNREKRCEFRQKYKR